MIPDALSPQHGEFWLRLVVAVVAGAAIGMERQYRGKVAGVRTSILICLGTAVFVALGSAARDDSSDPTRVLGQVVTGIGFVGGGVILARGDRVTGVTTASVIWMLAAVGATIGLGYLQTALVLTLTILVILIGVERLENLGRRQGGPLRGSGMYIRGDGDD